MRLHRHAAGCQEWAMQHLTVISGLRQRVSQLPWAHSHRSMLIESFSHASLIPFWIRPVVIGAVHAFPETVIVPEPEPRGVNDKEHDVHGIAFRVREAE